MIGCNLPDGKAHVPSCVYDSIDAAVFGIYEDLIRVRHQQTGPRYTIRVCVNNRRLSFSEGADVMRLPTASETLTGRQC